MQSWAGRGAVILLTVAATFGVVGLAEASGWSVQTLPGNQPAGPLSCTTMAACSVLANGARADRWNGRAWSVQSIPAGDGLSGISCPSRTACFSVGSVGGSGTAPLIERWNGAKWSLQVAPRPAGVYSSDLVSVSCPSTRFCMAVGTRVTVIDGLTALLPLVERWNGSAWSIVSAPVVTPTASNGGGGYDDELDGVSCTSANACTAVGTDGYFTLVERWNGVGWSIQPSPNRDATTTTSALNSVSCASNVACTAVGLTLPNDFVAGHILTLGERWNGSSWSIQRSPSPRYAPRLSSVSCASSIACTAVGTYGDRAGVSKSLIEQSNGPRWTIPHTPKVPNSFPGGVSCTSPTACMVAGSAFDSKHPGGYGFVERSG
jgi:hypothetical protein